MNICILGSTGYLGNKIIEYLLETDNGIYCIYRKNTNSLLKYENKKNVQYIVSDYEVLKEFFFKVKIDCLINASCTYIKNSKIDNVVESNLIFPSRCLSLAVESYYGINSESNSYQLAKKQNYKQLRIISIGTGLPNKFNLYTYTKEQFNKLGHYFSNEYGLEFINIELQNYFGENEPKDRFLPSIITKMLKNEDIPLTQGEQLRDFIYINDVISAIKLLIIKKEVPPYMDIPLGSGDAPSIKELVLYIKELLKSKSDLQFGKVPLRPNEPSSYANLSLYHMLGGEIEYSWKDGIKNMLIKEGIL